MLALRKRKGNSTREAIKNYQKLTNSCEHSHKRPLLTEAPMVPLSDHCSCKRPLLVPTVHVSAHPGSLDQN